MDARCLSDRLIEHPEFNINIMSATSQNISWWSGTNSSLGIDSSTFSLQLALNPSLEGIIDYDLNIGIGGYPGFIFVNGCTQPDGSQNCTATCTDESTVFGSLESIHNCLVYPTLADQLAATSLPVNVSEFLAGLSYVSSPKGSALSLNITSILQNCLLDYCDTLNGCASSLKRVSSDDSPTELNSTFYFASSHDEAYNARFDVCLFQTSSVNPDIGGVGVLQTS